MSIWFNIYQSIFVMFLIYNRNQKNIIRQILVQSNMIKYKSNVIKQITKNLSDKMSSIKNHTKNQLARISAKINQLKKKYPASSQLYSHCQKKETKMQNKMSKHQSNSETGHQREYDRKCMSMKHKPNGYIVSNSYNYDNYQNNCNVQNYIVQPNRQPTFYYGKQNQRNVHQTYHQNYTQQKQSYLPNLQYQLNYQKPLNEYKKELTNLKRQILTSLDFDNFHFTNNTVQAENVVEQHLSNQRLFNQSKDMKKVLVTDMKKTLVEQTPHGNPLDHKITSINLNKNQDNFESLQNTQRNNPLLSRQIMVLNRQNIQKQQMIQQCSILKHQIQKISAQFCYYKQQTSNRLALVQGQMSRFQLGFSQSKHQVQEINSSICALKQNKNSQYDLKIVQIQNQSINKLSKQLYRQIQNINVQIDFIQKNAKMVPVISQHPNGSGSMQVLDRILNQLQSRQSQIERSSQRIEQFESRVFRQIFDVRNQIQLIHQKFKKQDYMQKALRSLIPGGNKDKDYIQSQMLVKIRTQLLNDHQFINQLQSDILSDINQHVSSILQQNLSKQSLSTHQRHESQIQKLNSKVQMQISQARGQLLSKFTYSIQNLSQSIKQCQTKMTSYGILIENVQQNLKQLSHVQKEDLCTLKFKAIMSKDIEEIVNDKLQYFKQQISHKISQNKQPTMTNQDTQNDQQIKCQQITSQAYEIQSSKVSNFTRQQVYHEFWPMSVETSTNQELIGSLVKSKQNQQQKKTQSSLLLDQLVKNSLTFSLMKY